jgi:hypothetical protein
LRQDAKRKMQIERTEEGMSCVFKGGSGKGKRGDK